MKYRIKIVTFKTGRKVFYAQVKSMFVWKGLMYNGDSCFITQFERDSRDIALEIIDRHYTGNCKQKTIEFEYINKS